MKKTIKNMSINLINEDIYLTMNLINELKNHGKKNRYLEKYLKYKRLLINQVQVLRSFKNQEDILRRAQIVYKLKKRESSYNYIKLATVDFELLERNCDKWNKVFIK